MDINKFLSMATTAAILGLFILNADGTVKVLNAAGGNLVNYIQSIQGPAGRGGQFAYTPR